MQAQPKGLPWIFRVRHPRDALAPRSFGLGQTKPAKRASWAEDPDAATHFNTAAYTGASRGASANFRDRHRPDALAPRIFGPGRTEPPKRASWADANDNLLYLKESPDVRRRTFTPPHTQVHPEGLPRNFRDRHRPDALAPRIFGPGRTEPPKRASWADANDKPDGGN
ncbi:hypothetical protein CMV_026759 [Castanea mollissima]|uniref:Uncharacterized protein n=1 Tax=Castanea mollissima TaxID=60419 RepID=A0A8J4QJF8_9ROSI|nr:hypothetical protein CMV_026759 [Castanea mollissima]